MTRKEENNVLRKLRSKRGFTIVEVLVAFVIFAIMAAMVAMIINQTNRAKADNYRFSEEIEAQKEQYYLKDHKKEYKSADKEGTLTFNFEGSSPLNIDYSVGDPNAEDDDNLLALEYFIGNVDYEGGGSTPSPGGDDNNGPGSVTTRLDTRIYGSNGIDYILLKLKRDTSYTGTGYRYAIGTLAVYSGLDEQQWYAQYRLIFPSKILDYGYTNQDENQTSYSSRLQANSYNFEVYSPYSRTLRIASKQTSSETTPAVINNGYVYYYVVLEEQLESVDAGLDCNKIFGYSDTAQTPTFSGTSYKFTPYVETITDKSGNTTIENHINIFGAFPAKEDEG